MLQNWIPLTTILLSALLTIIRAQDDCDVYDGRQGICIRYQRCDEALKLLEKRRPNSLNKFQKLICDTRRGNIFVCCPDSKKPKRPKTPPPPTQPTPAPQPAVTLPPINLNEECGISFFKPGRIVGGTPAKLKSWPWMAALFIKSEGVLSKNYVSCGGALISPEYILTAAHCTLDENNANRPPTDFVVRLGDLDINSDSDGAQPVDFAVKEVKRHEKYNSNTFDNDIALLKLAKPAYPFTDAIRPVCIPDPSMKTQSLLGSAPYIAGWGTIAFGGNSSSQLRQVMVTVTDNDSCQKAYTGFGVTINPTQLCAGVPAGGVDACQGDSGGPMMDLMPASSKYNIIGVVSYGFKCAEPGFPGIYTRVTEYIDWIQGNI